MADWRARANVAPSSDIAARTADALRKYMRRGSASDASTPQIARTTVSSSRVTPVRRMRTSYLDAPVLRHHFALAAIVHIPDPHFAMRLSQLVIVTCAAVL